MPGCVQNSPPDPCTSLRGEHVAAKLHHFPLLLVIFCAKSAISVAFHGLKKEDDMEQAARVGICAGQKSMKKTGFELAQRWAFLYCKWRHALNLGSFERISSGQQGMTDEVPPLVRRLRLASAKAVTDDVRRHFPTRLSFVYYWKKCWLRIQAKLPKYFLWNFLPNFRRHGLPSRLKRYNLGLHKHAKNSVITFATPELALSFSSSYCRLLSF